MGGCCSDESGDDGARYQEVNGVAPIIAATMVSASSADGVVGRKRVALLPFLPKTTDKVDKRLKHGDEVFIQRIPDGKNFSHNIVSLGDDMSLDVRTEESGLLNPIEGLEEGLCSFTVEVDDDDGRVREGSVVRLKLTKDFVYMTVNEKLAVEFVDAGAECGPAATFTIFKERRPANVKHNDHIYLLNKEQMNFVDVGPANGKVYCRRWERTNIQSFKISKGEVLKSGIKEELLAIQFEAFDLDGNGAITKAEVEFMLDRVAADDDLGDVDTIMQNCDPDMSGGISFEEFCAHFAGQAGWTEERLQHSQALGNVAQRVSDCIYEEEALIEVLGTCVSSSMMPAVKRMYEVTFKESIDELVDNMGDNTGEQDGWFFSNYWKLTVKALFEDEVALWTRALIDSMKGLGTDENSLLTLVCTIPERLRDDIHEKFEADYGKSLVKTIESETSFNFKKVLVMQAMKPQEARATALNGAMVGLGTDEKQLIRILAMCDFQERQLIKAAYADMFEKDLLSDVEGETSGDFKKALQGIIMAKEEDFDVDADCEELKAAMDGWGTDEAALISKICSKSPRQMELLNDRFEELYSKRLLHRVRDETSGYFREVLESVIRHPMKQLAESVRYCIEGWGTDDTGLITCLVHLPEFKRKQLIEEYKDQFGRDLIEDVEGDTSGDYRQALLALVNPAPVTWARALKGAMKGLGTADELLINFMVIAKDHMDEVRVAFAEANSGQLLADWIEGDCSGDYKNMLLAIADRSSEDDASDFIMPIYWAQRLHDAFHDVARLIDILVSLPAVAVRKGTKVFEDVYEGRSLLDCLSKKCDEKSGFFFRSDNWKNSMKALLDMPVERRCKALNDAMAGWGTDEYTLTAVICTIPENSTRDVLSTYYEMYGRSLLQHVEDETSFNYKKALVCQTMAKSESRARALRGAMVGWGTDEKQLIRVITCATMKERGYILQSYQAMYEKDLIEDIEGETGGYFRKALVAILRCRNPTPEGNMDYESDCNALKEACDGAGTDEEALISLIAGKSPQQLENLQQKWAEMFGDEKPLMERIEYETTGIFESVDFRETLLGLLRTPGKQLAASVRYCIEGWGTDDTGLCTLLSHLTERQRAELRAEYMELTGNDLIEAIQGDTSGDYQRCLCASVRPFPEVWAEALVGAMKGLGTSDNLLINWMVLAKERMDEVREAFEKQTGQPLAEWIESECSADYKDTLIALAKRKVTKFPGSEAGLTIAPPLTSEGAIDHFRNTFRTLCKIKKENPDDNLIPSEEYQQEMGMVFAYFGSRSSVAPNLDRNGVWDLTNAIGFPPADQDEDLSATFWEWDYDGSGEISWNNFVQEMTTRVNDPTHWDSPNSGLNI